MIPNYNGPTQDEPWSSLNKLSKNELQELLSDETKLKNLAKESAEVKRIIDDKEACMLENRHLAESNLALEPAFTEKKVKLSSAYEKLQQAKSQYNDLKSQIGALNDSYSPRGILDLLRIAHSEAEDNSEKLVSQLFANELDIEGFLKEYLPLRKLCNERRVKCDKLIEQLNSGRLSNNSHPLYPSHAPSLPTLHSLPTLVNAPTSTVSSTMPIYPALQSLQPSYGFNLEPG